MAYISTQTHCVQWVSHAYYAHYSTYSTQIVMFPHKKGKYVRKKVKKEILKNISTVLIIFYNTDKR